MKIEIEIINCIKNILALGQQKKWNMTKAKYDYNQKEKLWEISSEIVKFLKKDAVGNESSYHSTNC